MKLIKQLSKEDNVFTYRVVYQHTRGIFYFDLKMTSQIHKRNKERILEHVERYLHVLEPNSLTEIKVDEGLLSIVFESGPNQRSVYSKVSGRRVAGANLAGFQALKCNDEQTRVNLAYADGAIYKLQLNVRGVNNVSDYLRKFLADCDYLVSYGVLHVRRFGEDQVRVIHATGDKHLITEFYYPYEC